VWWPWLENRLAVTHACCNWVVEPYDDDDIPTSWVKGWATELSFTNNRINGTCLCGEQQFVNHSEHFLIHGLVKQKQGKRLTLPVLNVTSRTTVITLYSGNLNNNPSLSCVFPLTITRWHSFYDEKSLLKLRMLFPSPTLNTDADQQTTAMNLTPDLRVWGGGLSIFVTLKWTNNREYTIYREGP
jgi:hypothetical protein